MKLLDIASAILMIAMGFSLGHYIDWLIELEEFERMSCLRTHLYIVYDVLPNPEDYSILRRESIANNWYARCYDYTWTNNEYLDTRKLLGYYP